MSHDSQEAATAPDEAETDDELDTPGPLGTAGDAAADSLSQQLVVITSEDGSEHRYQGQQHWDGQTSANSTPGSSNSSVNSGMHLWESAQPLLLKYVAPALVLLVSLRWLLRKLQRRDTPGSIQHDQPAPEAVEPEPTLAVYASDFVLEPPPTNSPRAAFLEGLRCVAAEHVAVQGAVLGCGLPSLWQQRPTASDPAPVIKKLLNLGVTIAGQGSTQPCNYPTLGNNIRNPVGRFRVAGGGASGPAVAVALGEADVAVGSDFLGSVRLPAACLGLYAFVTTPGTLGSYEPSSGRLSDANGAADGPSSSRSSDSSSSTGGGGGSSWRSHSSGGAAGSVETVGFIAAEMGQLCRITSCLGVPGAANLRHEVTQVVVAEDLFQLCEVELSSGILAVKRAVLQWAGHEQAGSVQLMQFLEANTTNWRHLALPESSSNASRKLPQVLQAISYAAKVLYHAELAQRYGAAGEAAAAAQAAAADDEQQQQQHEELDPLVAAALQSGATITQQELKIAQDIAKEVQDVLRTAVKKDVVVVIPCVPGAPPRLDAPAATADSWLAHAHAFACITALGGCPAVVLPVGSLPDGAPLGLCLFGQSRTDQRLLAVADKLVPHIQAELVKLQQQATAEAVAATGTSAGGAPSTKSKARGKGAAAATAAARRGSQERIVEIDPKRAERAERAKGRGNEAFKAGRYMDAIKAYSEAIKLHPGNPVYANNRAMAYLKVFSFEAAEADCNRALSAAGLAPADRVKALLRRGTARMHKGDLRGARADFREVLAAEPNNRQAREELKALQQQEQDMEDTRRQHVLAAAAAAAANGGAGPPGAPGFPPELAALDPATAAQLLGASGLGPLGGMGDAAAAGLDGSSAEQFAEMLRSGGMSVVLGQNGQAVSGPSGEPVIVGPDGQEVTIGPSGRVKPYKARRSGA